MNLIFELTLITLLISHLYVESFMIKRINIFNNNKNSCNNKTFRQVQVRENIDSKDFILLESFLSDAESLGPIRFVVIGPGAILETVGSFSNLRYSDSVKGKLATISSESPNFECHIRLNEIKKIELVEIKKFEKLLYIIRFQSLDGTTLLSSILHKDKEDNYKLKHWDEMKTKYGTSIVL